MDAGGGIKWSRETSPKRRWGEADPGMDGLDTYKKILEMHPGQKAIIASGFSETDRVKEVESLGAGAYIGKPLLLEK